MKDIKIFETGNGGSIELKGKDLVIVEGLHNMIYLALFGGNMISTPSKRNINEQNFDFWANTFLKPDSSLQFNSKTEKTLNDVALNSQGRQLIQNAVLYDLDFLKKYGTVTANVSITGPDKILIEINIQEPNNSEAKEFKFIWDGTKKDFMDGSVVMPKISDSFSPQSCLPGIINIYDFFGDLVQTEIVGSGTTKSIIVDSSKILGLNFPFDAGESSFKVITIKDGQQGTIISQNQDGASGTITFKYNGGAFVDLTTLFPLSLSIGDTLQPQRTNDAADGNIELIGIYE